jgi:hypothetical protein
MIYLNKRLIQNKFTLAKRRANYYEEMRRYYLATFPEHNNIISKWDEISLQKICKLTAVNNKKYNKIK